MDIVTLGAALNGSAEYVNSHFKGGSNIQIVNNPDGTQTINASGEVSSEDAVARAEIAEMKDGENLDSFGDVEAALATKANTSTTYTKTEVDTALSAKANSADVYSKTAVDTALGNKADKSATYTKTEVDTALNAKANATDVYSKSDVDTALNGKVDKETGKGLSTNDYTTAEKTKLAGIAEGAEVNEIDGIKVNNTTVNPDANKVVNITVPTTAADVSALPDTTKYATALNLTINSSTFIMTGQLKDQNGDNLGTAQTIDLPLESVVVGGSYNSQTKKVVLTLQNGNTIEFSVADLVSGLQTELSASNKLNPAYINYDSTHRVVSDTEKSTWNGKQNALSSTQLDAVNSGIDSTKVEQIESNKNNILTLETMNGSKNKFNLTAWSNCTVTRGTKSISGTDITISATGGNCYTAFANPDYPTAANIPVSEGDEIVITWQYNTSDNATGQVYVFPNGVVEGAIYRDAHTYDNLPFTVPSGCTYITIRFGVLENGKSATYSNVQVMSKTAYDAGFTDYQPYAMSNAELTAAIQALQAQLANQ